MAHIGDDVYTGPMTVDFQRRFVPAAFIGPSPTSYGIGPIGRAITMDFVPATLSATAISAVQAIAGAGNALINGTLATAGVATLPDQCGRCLSMISTNAGDTTQTVTVTGTDFLGNAQTERRTLNGTTIVNLTKAFKTVTQVAISAALTGNFSMGNRDVFGLPVFVSSANYVEDVHWAGVLAQDAGTFAAGDTTLPATNATNDTRGTYAPTSAANGTRRLTVNITLLDIHVAYNALQFSTATTSGAFGVQPV